MTQRSVLRFFLIGLPVGLAASIGVALYLYYHPIEVGFPGRSTRPAASDLIRKSPTEKDLLEYRRILTSELPDRSTGSPAALNATANWLASTLGPTNIGLSVKLQALGTAADAGRNIVVEVPGRMTTAEVIVVCTAYDAQDLRLDGANGTALLMMVANAFVGLPQQRTVVFAFLCRDEPPLGQRSGTETLLASLRTPRRTLRGVLDVRVRTVSNPGGTLPPGNVKIQGLSQTPNEPWSAEAWLALTARQPPMASLERLGKAELDHQEIDGPLLSRLAWWRQATPPPPPFLLLVLHPAAPDDTASVLALARSIEGMVQALANR